MKKGNQNVMDSLCKKILASDAFILSLTVNDDKGEIMGHAYSPEYEKKYLELAKEVRTKAGLFSALIFGITSEPEKVFGEIEAIVRIYAKAKLILIPFASNKLMVTLLTKKEAETNDILAKARPLLKVR
ncbi:MAG: hypothetical protein OK457_08390 [Thaumarchaeota archaeon]|nr:hypothetical protein [Nitrososphaerota archaeon]